MARVTIRHLQTIDGLLRYRRYVPRDLQPVFGKREWTHALGLPVGQERLAARLVEDYDAAYARLIAQERVRLLHKRASIGMIPDMAVSAINTDHHAAVPSQEPPAPEPKPKVLLSEAYRYDLEAYGGSRNERVFQNALDCIKSICGDIDILTFAAKDVQAWINACLSKQLKPSTIRRYINVLRAILNRYFRDHDIDRRNPFSKPKVRDAGGTSTDRLPFHRDHLKLINTYFSESSRVSDEAARIIALLKLTGARPLEIGGLAVDDLILDHDIPHIWIRTNRFRRLKTKGSERRIPLIGTALEAAEAAKSPCCRVCEPENRDHFSSKRSAKTTQPSGALFPPACHDTNSLSQRLNKLIRRSGLPRSPRLVVYSFRHTLEEALRAAGVREHTQKRIMGHTDTSITGRYGAPVGMLEELRDALKAATGRLGKVDISIFSSEERV